MLSNSDLNIGFTRIKVTQLPITITTLGFNVTGTAIAKFKLVDNCRRAQK